MSKILATSTRRGRVVCWALTSSRSVDLNFRLASHKKLSTSLGCTTTTRTYSAEWFAVDRRRVHGSDEQLKISPLKDEFLFCHPLKTTAKAVDVFNAVGEFFAANGLSWDIAGSLTAPQQ